jgi:catechol 2,3-dioxygenase-like lactoylglutathione lyase family enzyme
MPESAHSRPVVGRILETSLYVENLDASKAFYERVFGFPVLLWDRRMCAMAVPGREVLLLFLRGGSVGPSVTPFGAIPPHDGHGAQHLCFSITRAALDHWAEHLGRCGIAIESRVDWPKGGSSLYFRDPDGHSIEVGTPGLWQNDPVD